jgi:hypothetical protein
VRQECKGDPAKLEGGMVRDPDGPLWYRGLASGDVAAACRPATAKARFAAEKGNDSGGASGKT